MRDWFQNYKAKYKEDPTILSVYGYQIITLAAAGMEKAGPNLNPSTLAKGIDGLNFPRDMFGGDEQRFTPTRHLGSNRAKLCQIVDGRWRALSDFITD